MYCSFEDLVHYSTLAVHVDGADQNLKSCVKIFACEGSPRVRVIGHHIFGLEITWTDPQQSHMTVALTRVPW